MGASTVAPSAPASPTTPTAPDPFLTGNWVGVAYIANHWGRRVTTIRRWCRDGTLVNFGLQLYYQDLRVGPDSRWFGKWWIRIPDTGIDHIRIK